MPSLYSKLMWTVAKLLFSLILQRFLSDSFFYKSQPLYSLIISGYLYFLKANYAVRVTYLVCFNKKESFSKMFIPE